MFDKAIKVIDAEIRRLEEMLSAQRKQREEAVAASEEVSNEMRSLVEKVLLVYGREGLADVIDYINSFAPAIPPTEEPKAIAPVVLQLINLVEPDLPDLEDEDIEDLEDIEMEEVLLPGSSVPVAPTFVEPIMSLGTNKSNGWVYFDQEAFLKQQEGVHIDDMDLLDERAYKLLNDYWRVEESTDGTDGDVINTTFKNISNTLITGENAQEFSYKTTSAERELIDKLFAISEEKFQDMRPLSRLVKPRAKFVYLTQRLVGLMGKEPPTGYLSAKQIIKSLRYEIVGMTLPTPDGGKVKAKAGQINKVVAPFLTEEENKYLEENF